MADYDFSKPAPDRSHRVPINSGSGGFGLIAAGAVIVLAVLYGIFGGSGTAPEPDAGVVTPAAPTTTE